MEGCTKKSFAILGGFAKDPKTHPRLKLALVRLANKYLLDKFPM